MRNVCIAVGLPLALLLGGIAFGGTPAEVSPKGLIAHYTFDEGGGENAKDSSASDYTAKVIAAGWVKTDAGHALEFDGKSAHVDCGEGSRLKLKDKMTVCAWIHPTGKPAGEPVIVGEATRNWAITHYKGRAHFYISSGGNWGYRYVAVPYHQWSHVAGTYDGKTLKLYLNGALRAAKEVAGGAAIKTGLELRIGGANRQGAFYNGMIDGVRIYARALTEEEIMKLAVRPGSEVEKATLSAKQRQAATRFFKTHAEPVAVKKSDRQLWLANRHVGIEFVAGDKGFYLSRVYGIASGQDFLHEHSARSPAGLWHLVLRQDRGRDEAEVTVTNRTGAKVSSRIDKQPSAVTLRLRWEGLPVRQEQNALDVEVAVTVKQGDPLSTWRINVTNRSKTYGLWNVVFPVLELVPIGGSSPTNRYVLPYSRGTVAKDPFNSPYPHFGYGRSGEWPGGINMQFQALYDQSGTGLYLAAYDGEGYKKRFYFAVLPKRRVIEYKVGHYPANMGYPAEDYRMTYDVCIGPFRGDWYDACQMYRQWATKQQWCAPGPLATRKDIPRWYKEAPLALYTSSKEGEWRVDETRDRMIAMLEFIGTDLPIDWYTWKKHVPDKTHYNREGSPWKVPDARPYPCSNIHDGNYPLMPALPNFAAACKAIRERGGHVKPYVCAKIFDPGLNENSPFAAQAKPHARRHVDGKVVIAERNLVSWGMCFNSPWWRNRMAETVTELIKRENASGVYFDTFGGGSVQCFHTAHEHSHGGGNDPYLGARKISEVVRGAMKKADPESVMSGENPAETAIDLLDGFLYRWTTWPEMTPLFATVYGDYVCRNGMRLTPGSDGFYIQCTAMFTEGGQVGRFPLHGPPHGPSDYLKDFERGSKHTDRMKFLRKLCKFWRPEAGGRYLAYGQLLRPIQFTKPDPVPTASYIEQSKYVSGWFRSHRDVKEGLMTFPALQTGVFRAPDDSIGIFVVNVSDKAIPYSFELTPGRYPVKRKLSFDGQVRGHDVVFLNTN